MIEQVASTPPTGIKESDDSIILAMKESGVPVTREHYIDFAYMGDPPPPEEWGAELEAQLPPQLQDFSKLK